MRIRPCFGAMTGLLAMALSCVLGGGACSDGAFQHARESAEPVYTRQVQQGLVGALCTYDSLMEDGWDAPHGAVGYLSDGCTATLIDPSHILTAAHCVIDYADNDKLRQNLNFYPNFNGTDNEPYPPRHAVIRAVTGLKAENDAQNAPAHWSYSDWAVATLATPVTSYATVPVYKGPVPTSEWVTILHYTRDEGLWNLNVPAASACCQACGLPGSGICGPSCLDAPYPDEVAAGFQCNNPSHHNFWWQNALKSIGMMATDADRLNKTVGGLPTGGGSSGSGHLVELAEGWFVFGVTHTGVCDTGAWGSSSIRFADAPWYASNVAVSIVPGGEANKTALYAIDADRDRLKMRKRLANSILMSFDYWEDLFPIPTNYSCADGSSECRIAAFTRLGLNEPGLVLLDSNGQLAETYHYSGSWQGWGWVPTPAVGGTLSDIDASYDGRTSAEELFAVGNAAAGYALFLQRQSAAPQAPWQLTWQVAMGPDSYQYQRVTAIKHQGDVRNQVWALTAAGGIRTSYETFATPPWTAAADFTLPPLDPAESVVDIDAGVDFQNKAMLVAVTSAGRVLTRTADSTFAGSSWAVWTDWGTDADPRWDINRGTNGSVHLSNVTADRMRETWNVFGLVPVIFATDNWGNVYQRQKYCMALMCTPTTGFVWTKWMPFYGRRVHSSATYED